VDRAEKVCMSRVRAHLEEGRVLAYAGEGGMLLEHCLNARQVGGSCRCAWKRFGLRGCLCAALQKIRRQAASKSPCEVRHGLRDVGWHLGK